MLIKELLNEKGLQRSDLVGEPRKIPRLQKFIAKINSPTGTFKTEIPDDPEVKITPDPDLLKNLEMQVVPLSLPKEPDGEIPLRKLTKTSEFGGKEPGASLNRETVQREALDIAIKQNLGDAASIPLKVGHRTVNAAGAKPSKSGVKSDITIIDETGKDVAWISVKHGTVPTNFGQWGGVTEPPFDKKEEVQIFKKKVTDILQEEYLSKKV